MTESSAVQAPIMEFGETTGWLCRLMEYRNRRNCPDLWCMKDGRLVIFECKVPGADPRPGQDLEIKRLRYAGMEVHVPRTAREGVAILDRYNKRDRQ